MKALRVMIVEDEAVIAMLLDEVLTAMGHDVCARETTEAGAVAAAVRCRPDLMIVDAGLGQGSGVAAVEKILRAGFVPHVFVTGRELDDEAFAPHAVVLQKPFQEAGLVQAIERALAVGAPPRKKDRPQGGREPHDGGPKASGRGAVPPED